MTMLQNSSSATASTATEGDVKTFLDNLRTFMADLLGTDSANKGAALAQLGAALHGTVAKSSAYTVVAADRGKVINCTGSGGWTLNVQAAATLGDGFVFAVSNVGTGIITIDPNLAEKINGENTYFVSPADTVIVYCTGSEFLLFGKSPYPGCGQQVFTASGTFTVPVGVRAVKVTIAGAGGGGGSATSGTGSRGGGGGSGAVAIKTITGLIGGSGVSVTVGAGGTAASSGGVSSFGSYISVPGGGGGVSNVVTDGAGAGTAGTATGDWVVSGLAGGTYRDSVSGTGANFNTLPLFSGIGGAGIPSVGNGNPASGIGAGGGGAARGASGSYAGGAGAKGVVIVEW